MSKIKKSLLLFIILCFALSSIFYYLIIAKNMLDASTLLMWCPGVAAIIVKMVYHRGENILMIRKVKVKYILYAILLPLIYWGISYSIYVLIYGKSVLGENMLLRLLKEPQLLIVLLLTYLFTGLGEEIGWRGYLMPKMDELFGFRKGTGICGIIWFLWHLPVFLAGYVSTIPLWYQLPTLFILIIALAYPMADVTLRSRSVWPAAVLHGTHNMVSQLLLDQSIGGDMRPFLVGETGIISVAVLAVVAWIISKNYLKIEGLAPRKN